MIQKLTKLKHALLVALIIAITAGGTGYLLYKNEQRTYTYTALGMTPIGPQPLVRFQVKGPKTLHDGTVCFVDIPTNKRACAKFFEYILVEAEIQ